MVKMLDLKNEIKQLKFELENIGVRSPKYSEILKINDISIKDSIINLEIYINDHVKFNNPKIQMLLLLEGIKEELLIKGD